MKCRMCGSERLEIREGMTSNGMVAWIHCKDCGYNETI